MSVTIIEQSREFNKKEVYNMTAAMGIEKISDFNGEQIDVAGYIVFEDTKDDKVTTVLSIVDTDGRVYATNSETFRRNFLEIANIMSPELFTISVCAGESKAGRTFYFCRLV